MKKHILTFLLLVCFTCAVKAQTDSTKQQKEEYCMLTVYHKGFGSKIVASVDNGRPGSDGKDDQILDSAGKPIVFYSEISALNYMAKKGWLFVTSYIETLSNQNYVHYVLRRPLN